eukprot:TRINITY_DN15366_c0_g1_i1.p2 TRINITY_DN15366_c0_g1~~TRINITY_DN15366_c0_g1_i1.p2  ORF type:complete len:105 (+),score=41.17 TRINITY_DN15366_c0_g1_i1:534-848(+)
MEGGYSAAPFRRKHSLPSLGGAEEAEGELALAEDLDLPIWKRMSVPELAKAVGEVQKRANQLLLAQDDHAAFRAEHSGVHTKICLLYTSPSPRDRTRSRMPSSA